MDQIDYQQPDFYHFSEDSILLSKFVIEKIKNKKIEHLIDICAGCGVVGIEVLQACPSIKRVTFIEKQKIFKDYISANIRQFLKGSLEPSVLIQDLKDYTDSKKAELIIANPPYFFLEESRVSTNLNRAVARNFSRIEFKEFISFFKRNLSKKGMGYFCGPKSWMNFRTELGFECLQELKSINIYSVTSHQRLS